MVAIQLLATRQVDIVGNVVSEFATNALQAPNIVAIRIAGGGDVRVSANHLSDLGPRKSFRGYAAGIELVAPFTLAHIADNIITRVSAGDLAAAEWHAIRISAAGKTSGKNLFGASMVKAGKDLLLLTGKRLLAFLPASANSLSVRGNQIMARGCDSPLVLAEGVDTILFNDNHCEGEAGDKAKIAFALVELAGGAVIASQNRVRWTNNDFDAMNISVPNPLIKTFTVLGNITMGNIRINGSVLPEPWDKLNILVS